MSKDVFYKYIVLHFLLQYFYDSNNYHDSAQMQKNAPKFTRLLYLAGRSSRFIFSTLLRHEKVKAILNFLWWHKWLHLGKNQTSKDYEQYVYNILLCS